MSTEWLAWRWLPATAVAGVAASRPLVRQPAGHGFVDGAVPPQRAWRDAITPQGDGARSFGRAPPGLPAHTPYT